MMEIMNTIRKLAPNALAAIFATSGVLHFVRPETFAGIVPRFLPVPETLVYASGAAELVCAAGLFARRRWAAAASVVLLVAILPANIQMAADMSGEYGASSWQSIVAWVRVPLQIPLIWAALQSGKSRRAEAK
jgi:uncharacterized membrane protein